MYFTEGLTNLPREAIGFSRGSVPVFLWKHIATCDFPGGVLTPCPLPLDPPMSKSFTWFLGSLGLSTSGWLSLRFRVVQHSLIHWLVVSLDSCFIFLLYQLLHIFKEVLQHEIIQRMKFWYLSHCQATKAQASAGLPEPFLFIYTRCGHWRRLKNKIKISSPAWYIIMGT